MTRHVCPRFARTALAGACIVLLLSACASPATDSDSFIPDQVHSATDKDAWLYETVRWTHEVPGCTGQCAKLVVDTVQFPDHKKLNALIRRTLVDMSWLDQNQPIPYDSLETLETYFWKNAGAHDEIDLIVRPRYLNRDLSVLQVDVGIYQTGMAHGVTGTHFINWDNTSDQRLTLKDMLAPGQSDAFESLLRQAHARWLKTDPGAQADPENYTRMWPFTPTDNIALTDTGLLVKYQSYEIAPYASGQPEILIPYAQLKGILRPAFLP